MRSSVGDSRHRCRIGRGQQVVGTELDMAKFRIYRACIALSAVATIVVASGAGHKW
jgi:hypothetical protein